MSKRQVPQKLKLFILAFVLLALAIGAWLMYRHEEVKYKDVLVLGHAGSGFFSPINPFNPLPANSMASIVKALEDNGADGIEVDVQLTQDGVAVLYHDNFLQSMTTAEGHIEEHPAAAVVGLKYDGGFFYNLFQEEQVITLEALLQYLATFPEAPYLHLDLRNYTPERHSYYARTLLALLRKYNYPLDKMVFISQNTDFLLAFRNVEPKAILMLDAGGDFEQTLTEAAKYKLNGICANGGNVTGAQVAEAKQQGLQVVLFGGKSPSRVSKMINMRPDAIQVNNVAAMRGMLP
ncbi:glycerophosphodiester phosphodiesterase [Pontibacter mangrovi]|uniref:Glycerophosphodiester phosphodiesterase n=1 Tax=Pontibacter mangrovi TaxID=2589816 RepID=A0A501WEA3_9BACT|nr:glycerophosphodiester phosphodiesterase [Pontibacter mangrovi]TPE43866.1 glycerophosphodiester phosphodiesterase [Pontibacter mangrovi]